MELYVANNTFNDFNGGIGIFGTAVYNGYKTIGIYSNTQGADSAGNYKGLFFVDGSGAINENVVLEYGDNILGTTALRPDYVSYDKEGSSEVALKNTVTFVEEKEQVGLTDSLEGLGLRVQELKRKKTYIVDSEGNGIEGAGTEENPYVLPEIPEPTPTETITTSLVPQVHNGTTYVGAKAVDPEFADVMLLSDGTRQHTGKIKYTGHGLTVGKYYYTSQTTAGAITDVKPTTGWVQQLFFVEDANTIQLDIEEAWNPDGGATTNIVSAVIDRGGLVQIDNMLFHVPAAGGRALMFRTTDVANTVSVRSFAWFLNNSFQSYGARYAINQNTFRYFDDTNTTFNTNADYQECIIHNESTGKTYRVNTLYSRVDASPNQIVITLERIRG
jgi:hypothetical protein